MLGGARRGACRELSGRRGAAGGGGALPARGAQVTRPPPTPTRPVPEAPPPFSRPPPGRSGGTPGGPGGSSRAWGLAAGAEEPGDSPSGGGFVEGAVSRQGEGPQPARRDLEV